MLKARQTIEFYGFGAFRLDTENRLLWRAGKRVPLTPKEFELLLMFVENAGRVLGKEDLLEAVWKDSFVEESTLARNISWLRKKLLAEDAGAAQLIETVPKRGYRFLPDVIVIESSPSALVVEEHTVQRVRIEETITFEDEANEAASLSQSNALTINPSAAADVANIADVFDGIDRRAAPLMLPAAKPVRSRNLMWLTLACGVVATAAISFAVYQKLLRDRELKTVVVTQVAPFSGLPGREDMPAFSSDGRQLAFAWNGGSDEDNANVDIYVKIIGAGDPVRLTKDAADDLNPTFSPDNRQVAFVRVLPTHDELMLVPALGGAERKVCDLRRSRSKISFSPDGGTIAVHDGDETGAPSGIFIVTVESGTKRRLTVPPPNTSDDAPAFAPDGKSVAFLRGFASLVREIFVTEIAAGDEPRRLTFDKTWISDQTWDGQKIVFASARANNNQIMLWRIPATSGGAPELIATGSKNFGSLTVAPDGRTIAFVENSLDTNIWRIEPARQPTPDAVRKLIASSRADHSPQFSPDGTRIAFASSRTGSYEIWIADADGTNARQLTNAPNSPAGSPRFSPDGKLIIYDAQVAATQIFLLCRRKAARRAA